VPRLLFGGGGEDWFGKAVAFAKPRRQRDAADGPVLAIFLPARAREVASDNTFDGIDPRLPYHHRAAHQRFDIGPGGEVERAGVEPQQVVADREPGEPQGRQPGQHPSLVGDAVGHDPVERADAVGRDNQQAIAEVVNIADFATAGLPAGQHGLQKWFGHTLSVQAGSSTERPQGATNWQAGM
jgi:hypothetical protein